MFGTHYTTIAYNTCVYVTLYTPLTRYCRWYICSAILSLILELCVSSRRWGSSWSGCFYLALGRCSPLYPTLRRRRRGSLLVTHGYLHVREEEGGGGEYSLDKLTVQSVCLTTRQANRTKLYIALGVCEAPDLPHTRSMSPVDNRIRYRPLYSVEKRVTEFTVLRQDDGLVRAIGSQDNTDNSSPGGIRQSVLGWSR